MFLICFIPVFQISALKYPLWNLLSVFLQGIYVLAFLRVYEISEPNNEYLKASH